MNSFLLLENRGPGGVRTLENEKEKEMRKFMTMTAMISYSRENQ